MIYQLEWLLKHANECQALINGRYVPARPAGGGFWFDRRLRAAWEVLLGRADAFRWNDHQ